MSNVAARAFWKRSNKPRSVREYLQHILDEAQYLAEQSRSVDQEAFLFNISSR